MAKKVNTPFLPLLLLLLFSLATVSLSATIKTLRDTDSDPENECVYTIYVRTGTIWKGGTDSLIGVQLAGADGEGVQIPDLVKWGGLMEADHDYYERGNLDIFSGRAPCMESPPCWMNLTSDGTGVGHGWYCNYVEVTATGPHRGCAQQLFTVEQWLATDTSPHQLYAERDNCPAPAPGSAAAGGRRRARGAVRVGV
ncbi:uncharacterized protein M6B38_241085 [Iris pallida]|uniref:PLAT domain-containing protein n=1 Tax=Iris pallida TaxID=29817 RepID=A0AAX6DIW6_IRIPA|nr:uncharacterized protein M6B38_241085 [Iris pallida]